jgi:hypothetical protein
VKGDTISRSKFGARETQRGISAGHGETAYSAKHCSVQRALSVRETPERFPVRELWGHRWSARPSAAGRQPRRCSTAGSRMKYDSAGNKVAMYDRYGNPVLDAEESNLDSQHAHESNLDSHN